MLPMKTTFSSSVLKALTAGRMRPRQMEEMHCRRAGGGHGRGCADAAGVVRGGDGERQRVRGTVVGGPAMGRSSAGEWHADGPANAEPHEAKTGTGAAGCAAVRGRAVRGPRESPVIPAALAGRVSAVSARAASLPCALKASPKVSPTAGVKGAAKNWAEMACAAGVPCGAALPYAPCARRGAGGRGAAMDGREGRRRITFWALPRCGPSWGFA